MIDEMSKTHISQSFHLPTPQSFQVLISTDTVRELALPIHSLKFPILTLLFY